MRGENDLKTKDFEAWLASPRIRSATRAFLAVVLLATMLHIVSVTGPLPQLHVISNYIARILPVGTALVLLLVPIRAPELAGPVGKCALSFTTTWRTYLLVAVAMGVVYVATHIATSAGAESAASALVIPYHAGRNLQALLLLRAYYELTMKSVEWHRGRIGHVPDTAQIVGVVLCLLVIDVYLRFDDLGVLVGADGSAAVTVYSGVFERDESRLYYDTICWALYAAVHVVLIARFQSRLIDVRGPTLTIVYLSCALAPISGLRENGVAESLAQLAFVVSSFGLFVMYAMFHWFVSDRIAYYFTSHKEVHYKVRVDRTEFARVQTESVPIDQVYMALALASDRASNNRAKKVAGKLRDRIEAALQLHVTCPAVHGHYPNDVVARRENFFRIRQCRVFILIYDSPGASGALIELGVALSHHRPTVICHSGPLPALARASTIPTPLVSHVPLLQSVSQTADLLIPEIRRMSAVADMIESGFVDGPQVVPPPLALPKPTEPVDPQPGPPPLPSRLDILFVSACNPRKRSRLDLEREIRDVQIELETVEHRGAVGLTVAPAARPDDLVRRLSTPRFRPVAVHFLGHGEHEGLVFRGDEEREYVVSGDILSVILQSRGVRLVVLNACLTAMHAAKLLAAVDVAIGTTAEVEDPCAVAFSVAFYRSLGNGYSVGDSYRDGIAAVGAHGYDSGVYFLVGEPNIVLVGDDGPPGDIPTEDSERLAVGMLRAAAASEAPPRP